MNERIKELAKTAREQMVALTAVDDEQWRRHEEFVEKFALLIVQECAGKVDFILREKSNGGGTMGDKIREHFGVEE